MQYAIDTTTRPFTLPSADAQLPTAPDAVLLLLGDDPAFGTLVATVCAVLDIEVVTLETGGAMEHALWTTRPIGVACSLSGPGAATACRIVKATARYHPRLPVMMRVDDDPETLGSLDAVIALCGSRDLRIVTERQSIEDLLTFIASAGRWSGQFGLMPV